MASLRIADTTDSLLGIINFEDQPQSAIHMFNFYCNQSRLPPLEDSADVKARMQHKAKLIDLWIFCSDFGVLKLQNKAMAELLALLTTPTSTPHLLKERDILKIWNRSMDPEQALKSFAAYALVAQIEEGTGPKKTKVDNIDERLFAQCEGLAKMLYKAQQQWNKFEMPKTPKKGKSAKTKWASFAASEEVKKAVMISETVPPVSRAMGVQEVTAAVKETSLAPKENGQDTKEGEAKSTPTKTTTPACHDDASAPTPASAMKIKREAPDDGEEEGSPSKKVKPFKKGEVVDLTID